MAEGGLSSNQSQESLNDCSGDPDSTSHVSLTVSLSRWLDKW